MDRVKSFKEVDTDRAWLKVHGRLQNDGLIPGHEVVEVNNHFRRRLAIAATILIIIVAGGVGYFFIPGLLAPRLLTVQTGSENSTYVQTLEEGSVVYLGNNSSLSFPSHFSSENRTVSLNGEAFFDITADPSRPFLIETENAIIEVLGTAFNLKSADGDFEVIVEEGNVRVSLRKLPALSETIGQWEMLTGSAENMEKLPVVDRTYLSWRMNRMQFRDERLDNIVSVISRNFNVWIDLADEEMAGRRLNVTFDDNNIYTIIEVIAFGLGLDYEILSDSSFRFMNRE
jgi:transmembrane sensor